MPSSARVRAGHSITTSSPRKEVYLTYHISILSLTVAMATISFTPLRRVIAKIRNITSRFALPHPNGAAVQPDAPPIEFPADQRHSETVYLLRPEMVTHRTVSAPTERRAAPRVKPYVYMPYYISQINPMAAGADLLCKCEPQARRTPPHRPFILCVPAHLIRSLSKAALEGCDEALHKDVWPGAVANKAFPRFAPSHPDHKVRIATMDLLSVSILLDQRGRKIAVHAAIRFPTLSSGTHEEPAVLEHIAADPQ